MKQKHQPHEIVVQIQAQDKENEGNGHEEQNDIDEENEVMEEWKQIYDVLDNIGEVFDVEEKDKVDAFTEKLGRMHNVIKKKADIINKTKKSELKLVEKVAILEAAKAKLAEKVDAMEASGSSCRECTLKDEVILNKEALANRKEKEAAEAKKQLGSQRKLVKNMKQNYEKAIDENNELKTTIDENKEYIKQLEEQCQTSDEGEDEVEEVEVARNPMNKNQSGHLCLTCNQRFVTNNGLEKHIQDKHTELWCDYCIHLARGWCKYGGVFYHVRHKQQQQGMDETRLCWEDANCTKIECCFMHFSLQDFSNLPQPRMPQVMRKQNQGRTWN